MQKKMRKKVRKIIQEHEETNQPLSKETARATEVSLYSPIPITYSNFCKRTKQPLKISNFSFCPFSHTGVKFQFHTQNQSQIVVYKLGVLKHFAK